MKKENEAKNSGFRIIKQKCSFCKGLGCNMCYIGEETIVINEQNMIVPFNEVTYD